MASVEEDMHEAAAAAAAAAAELAEGGHVCSENIIKIDDKQF